MAKKMFKYKISDLKEGLHDFFLMRNFEKVASAKILVREFCENDVYLKYLDSKGFYRFFAFNSFWTKNVQVSEIGSTDVFLRNLENAKSDKKSIGYNANEVIELTAENVNRLELQALFDIYNSPRVYMMSGINDDEKSWVLVEVLSSNPARTPKNFIDVNLTIKLPAKYAITKI